MYVPASSIVMLPCRRRRQEEDQERIQESFWMAKQQQQQWRYVLSGEKFTRQKRQYPIAYLYPSTYVAKIHQDNNFLVFLMISFGMSMTITVHHMDKIVLFCLHMWFSQCLLGMEEGRGYAWKTQYHHHHAVVWDIRRSKSKRGEGRKWKNGSEVISLPGSSIKAQMHVGHQSFLGKMGWWCPCCAYCFPHCYGWSCLLFSSSFMDPDVLQPDCRARDPRKQIKREPSYHA